MKKLFLCCCLASLFALPAQAQQATVVASCSAITFDMGNAHGLIMDTTGRLCVSNPLFSSGNSAISGNASGTTGAVVGTLPSAANQTAFICGFNVQAIGGTAAVGPIVVAGLIGGSQTYQGSASAAGGVVASQNFTPCIPASAVNTNITITTTADGTATAVNVNSWGVRQ